MGIINKGVLPEGGAVSTITNYGNLANIASRKFFYQYLLNK